MSDDDSELDSFRCPQNSILSELWSKNDYFMIADNTNNNEDDLDNENVRETKI
jgi:hypothetical protein